jgi:hypothetical protein
MSKVGWVLVIVLAANAVAASWWAWSRYALARALDTTVEGTVVVSRVEGTGRTTRYRFVVEYMYDARSYKVDGGPDADAHERIEHNPVGSKVPVYIDASNPSRAALRPSAGYVFWMVIAGGLLVATAIAVYYGLFRRT